MDATFVRQQPLVEDEFSEDGFEKLLVLFQQLEATAKLAAGAAKPPRVRVSLPTGPNFNLHPTWLPNDQA